MAAHFSSPKRTSLLPDMMMCSTSAKTVFQIEVNVPREEEVENTYEMKRAKYTELAAEYWMEGCHLS